MKKILAVILSISFFGIILFGIEGFFSKKALKYQTQQSIEEPKLSTDVYFNVEGPISGPRAPKLTEKNYPKLNLPSPFGESRIIIWTIAQQHRYFAALFLGGVFWIMVLELGSLITREAKNFNRYNSLAKEILDIVALVYSMTAILGVILLIGLLTLYPDFTEYLIGVFRPFFIGYGFLFLFLSLTFYVYYYTWEKMYEGISKWIHATLGILLNVLGITMLMIANSWGTFMMSPSGVDISGQFLGNAWAVLHNALWNPLNVLRLFGNLILGAAVIGAYAAFRSINFKSQEEKNYYDWVGYLALLGVVFALFTFPYDGFKLHIGIYHFRSSMGILLVGGLLIRLSSILVFLMGALFLGINYYLWQRINSIEEGIKYRYQLKYVFFFLGVCFLIYVTPSTLIMKAAELELIGGQGHPVISNFGTELSKQPAINIMMLVTIWSLLMWWRVQYKISKPTRSFGDAMLMALFLGGTINLIWIGIYSYYIPANVYFGLRLPMYLTPLFVLIFGSILTYMKVRKGQRIFASDWGKFPIRGHYILLFLAVTITWIMGLGGYLRSSVRLFWHATEIFRDASPWAFTHPIGFAGNVISFNTLLFWFFLLVILWVKKIGEYDVEREKLILDDNSIGQESSVLKL